MTRQADLFSVHSSTAELIVFPWASRIGRIREIADELATLPEDKWQRRFNHRSRNMAAWLRGYGFSEAEINAQVRALAQAVNAEMDQRDARHSIG